MPSSLRRLRVRNKPPSSAWGRVFDKLATLYSHLPQSLNYAIPKFVAVTTCRNPISIYWVYHSLASPSLPPSLCYICGCHVRRHLFVIMNASRFFKNNRLWSSFIILPPLSPPSLPPSCLRALIHSQVGPLSLYSSWQRNTRLPQYDLHVCISVCVDSIIFVKCFIFHFSVGIDTKQGIEMRYAECQGGQARVHYWLLYMCRHKSHNKYKTEREFCCSKWPHPTQSDGSVWMNIFADDIESSVVGSWRWSIAVSQNLSCFGEPLGALLFDHGHLSLTLLLDLSDSWLALPQHISSSFL